MFNILKLALFWWAHARLVSQYWWHLSYSLSNHRHILCVSGLSAKNKKKDKTFTVKNIRWCVLQFFSCIGLIGDLTDAVRRRFIITYVIKQVFYWIVTCFYIYINIYRAGKEDFSIERKFKDSKKKRKIFLIKYSNWIKILLSFPEDCKSWPVP